MLRTLLLAGAMIPQIGVTASAVELNYAHKYLNDKWYTYVYISGELLADDEDKFEAFVNGLASKDVTVILEGPGGRISAGILIGLNIENRHWDTSVLSGKQCVSACGLIWLAGDTRYASRTANIGFHAVSHAKGQEVSSGGNAVVGAYLRDLKFDYGTIHYLTSTPPDGMEYLTSAKAQQYKIDMKYYR
jgi:hypothetical protein